MLRHIEVALVWIGHRPNLVDGRATGSQKPLSRILPLTLGLKLPTSSCLPARPGPPASSCPLSRAAGWRLLSGKEQARKVLTLANHLPYNILSQHEMETTMTHSLNPLTRLTLHGHRYPMRAHDIYRAFGFNHTPPADFSDVKLIGDDGFTHRVYFLASGESAIFGLKQRAITGCPVCGKTLTVGCLDQHMTSMHKETAQ